MKWGKVGNFGEGIRFGGKIGEGCCKVVNIPLFLGTVFYTNLCK